MTLPVFGAVAFVAALFGAFLWLSVAALRTGRPVSRLGAAYATWLEETRHAAESKRHMRDNDVDS